MPPAGSTPTPHDDALTFARLERAACASGDGYWEHDLRTGLIWYSPRFNVTFGFAADRPAPTLPLARAHIHPDDAPRYFALRDAALAARGRFEYEVRYLDATQSWRWMHGRGQVFTNVLGEPEYIAGVVTEIQAEKEAALARDRREHELESLVRERTASLQAALALAEQRQQEAESANIAKSRFLAHMSHEIRTPLNGVLGLTELALRVAQSPEQRRYLETSHQSGQALLRMIDDVLDLSRIEAGNVELRLRHFDPAQVLAEALRSLLPLARRRDLLMVFDWVGDVPWVDGDDGALRQIVINLLGNALKFTERGQISMIIEARPDGDARVALTVTVSDTGPGVPEGRRAEIFEAFVQGDDSLSRAHGGAGLGLAIASRLAQAMGGSLQLDCPPDGGSVFTLCLGLPVVPVPEGKRLDAPPAPGRAWVVYQRSPGGRWMAAHLARLGWQAEVIYGLANAVERARAGTTPAPDAVLVAEQALLPGIDLNELRAALPQAQLRLLIRPDWHDPALEAQAARLHIQTLVAPVTPAQLQRLGADEDIVAESEAEQRDNPPALRPQADVLLVEDNPVNQLVGQEFLRALGLDVRVVDGGEAALAACLARTPALVLMDLQMPGMDGLEATRRLRALQQEGRWPGAPIVALTAHASANERAACRAAGMDGVLTKPLALDTLRRQLARWLAA